MTQKENNKLRIRRIIRKNINQLAWAFTIEIVLWIIITIVCAFFMHDGSISIATIIRSFEDSFDMLTGFIAGSTMYTVVNAICAYRGVK